MKAALLATAAVLLAAGAAEAAEGKHTHLNDNVERRVDLREEIDARVRDENNNFPVHLEIGDRNLKPTIPTVDNTFVLFSFIGPDGNVQYGCGNERGEGPFLDLLAVDKLARHAEADLTGILGDEIPCGGAVPQSVSVVCDTDGNERHDESTTLNITPEDRTRTQTTHSSVQADCVIEVDGVEYQSTQGLIDRQLDRTKFKPTD
jgi:hypothetical protein